MGTEEEGERSAERTNVRELESCSEVKRTQYSVPQILELAHHLCLLLCLRLGDRLLQSRLRGANARAKVCWKVWESFQGLDVYLVIRRGISEGTRERFRSGRLTLESRGEARPAIDGFVGHGASLQRFDVVWVVLESWGSHARSARGQVTSAEASAPSSQA